MRNPETQAWREKIPEQDTAPADALPLPDPAEWGVSPEEARDMLARQMCPICGEGPWKSPLNHVSRKHGINRHIMRDVCLLPTHVKVTDEESREKWSKNGRDKVDVLNANSERARGSRGRKMRMTRAFRASLGRNLERWMAENPEEMAHLRAEFRERVTSPDALERWLESQRHRNNREWSDEEREEFRRRMSAPEVEAKRAKRRAELRVEGCAVQDCARPHAAKGYCKYHWRKVQQYGHPNGRGRVGKRPKLSPSQMEEVRALYDGGMTQGVIAERLRVSQSIVSRVVRGEYVDG